MYQKKYIFPVLSFVILAVSVLTCVYISYFSQKNQSALTVPHLYYSEMLVTSIDTTGNVSGKTTIYRVDGMNGQPQVVSTLPQETSSAFVEFQPASLSYHVYPKTISAEFTDYPVRITGEGKEIQNLYPPTGGANFKGQIITRQQWVHPEGTYVTQAEVYCLDTPVEGPCGTSFRLRVQNLTTGEVKNYEADAFSSAGSGNKIAIAEQLSSTTAVFVVDYQQELMLQTLGQIDFATGEVSIIFPKIEPTKPNSYQFIRLSDDKRTAILLQWNSDDSIGSKAYIGLNLSTGEVIKLTKNLVTNEIEWPKNSPDIFYESIDSSHITKYNVTSGQETTVASNISLDQYLHPKRFTIKKELSSSGVYEGKLTLLDNQKKLRRVIFDQPQRSDAYVLDTNNASTSAKIGDIVYRFIGIDQ